MRFAVGDKFWTYHNLEIFLYVQALENILSYPL